MTLGISWHDLILAPGSDDESSVLLSLRTLMGITLYCSEKVDEMGPCYTCAENARVNTEEPVDITDNGPCYRYN